MFEYSCGRVYVNVCARARVCMCVCVVCVCVLQGKYEFRNFINTKTTKREKLIASVLTALGRVAFQVRYSKKKCDAPLPLFRTRR